MLSCYHPVTGALVMALSLGLFVTLGFLGGSALSRKREAGWLSGLARKALAAAGIFLALSGLVLWLTSYARSPLPFAGRPVLRGFLIQQRGRDAHRILSGEVFSMAAGSMAAILPVLEPGRASCNWMSREGAELDMPSLCDIAYVAPMADFDRLQVRVSSDCGVPDSSGYLNVQILAP